MGCCQSKPAGEPADSAQPADVTLSEGAATKGHASCGTEGRGTEGRGTEGRRTEGGAVTRRSSLDVAAQATVAALEQATAAALLLQSSQWAVASRIKLKNVQRAKKLLIDMPWLLADAVAGAAAPPNPKDGPAVTIVRAGAIEAALFKVYVTLSVSLDGSAKGFSFLAKTGIEKAPWPEWHADLHLGAASIHWGSEAKIKFLVLEEHKLGLVKTTAIVGAAFLTMAELKSAHGAHELLLEDANGDPVLSGTPLVPCHLTVTLPPASLGQLKGCAYQSSRLQVEPSISGDDGRGELYPRHVFMMSRGTRGDVQPFVALARGLCNELGWLVTICTEARWREFVVAKCADISRGAVRFLCSGGDTQRQTETWTSQLIMSSKAEALQALMMAASESNFFASAPVFMHQLGKLQAGHSSTRPVDLLVNSFTLTGVALMCGEAFQLPVAGFCLQPSCIPSDDKAWQAVVPIDHWGLSLVDRVNARLFSSHAVLKPLRLAFNNSPFSSLSLPKLRRDFGLGPSSPWKAAFKWSMPLVIPMLPSAFARPADWPASFCCTDFIFLRSSAPGGGKLADDQAAFIDAARAKGRKLMVMTFSSMPVPRAAALGAAVEMLTKSKHDFALLYVGKRQPDRPPADVEAAAARLAAEGKLLEAERADFGLLFREMDAFVVHGGLGTTVEALRMRKPTVVTGILLMDQRFWGLVCYDKGVGPRPTHIEPFKDIAVDWADRALDPASDYARAAAALDFGDEAEDGVHANVAEFARLVKVCVPPPRSHKGPSRPLDPMLKASVPKVA